jgi:UDP-N-acetylmuramoyl-tripeptide--D-alanyl-D-alanine ligase
MFDVTLRELCRLTNTTSAPFARHSAAVSGTAIDSRRVRPGDLFFALPGNSCHGSVYAGKALQGGAVAVVSDLPIPANISESQWVHHPSPISLLQQIGGWNRRQSDALVIGVTGSVGKTTTRQMISCVLRGSCHGIQSESNFNNELGVPLTLSRLQQQHAFAVVELGASSAGEIARLAALARPEFGVVTCVSAAHVSGFGSVEAIRRAKMELVEALEPGSTVFLNADDPAVRSMMANTQENTVLFGEAEDATVRATCVTCNNNQLSFRSGGTTFSMSVPGQRFLTSALAAIAVGRETGLRDAVIAEQLRRFRPGAGRGRVRKIGNITVIDDSYNASPASVAAAIETVSTWHGSRRRILVLGDMRELAELERPSHLDVGRQLANGQIDHTLVFGRCADIVASAAVEAGLPASQISVFSDFSTLQSILDCVVGDGDVVAIKGSRAMRLERLISYFVNRDQASLELAKAA